MTGQMDYMEALVGGAGAQAADYFVPGGSNTDLMRVALIAVGTGAGILLASTLSAGSDNYTIQVDVSDAAYTAVLTGLALYFAGDMIQGFLPGAASQFTPFLIGMIGAMAAQQFPKIPFISDLFKKD